MSIKKIYKFAQLTLLLITLFMVTGCSQGYTAHNIEMRDMGKSTDQEEAAYQAMLNTDLQTRYDWDYEGDLYWQDFSLERAQMNKEAHDYMEAEIKKLMGDQLLFFEMDVTLYNRSFDLVHQKKLDFKTAYESQDEHIKFIKIQTYLGVNEAEMINADDYGTRLTTTYEDDLLHSDATENLVKACGQPDIETEARTMVLVNDRLKYSVEEFKKLSDDERIIWLNESKSFIYEHTWRKAPEFVPIGSEADRGGMSSLIFNEKTLARLERKYGEKFVQVQAKYEEFDSLYYDTYAPLRDLTLSFNAWDSTDRDYYPHAIVQRQMSQYINSVIDELGYTDQVVQFNTHQSSQYNVKLPKSASIVTDIEIVKALDAENEEDTTSMFQYTLYAIQSEDEPNSKALYEVAKKVAERYDNIDSVSGFGKIIKMSDDKRKIIVDRFRKETNFLNCDYRIDKTNDWFKGSYMLRVDSNLFNVFELYGKVIEETYVSLENLRTFQSEASFKDMLSDEIYR